MLLNLNQKKLTPGEIWAKNNPVAAANKIASAKREADAIKAKQDASNALLATPGLKEAFAANGYTVSVDTAGKTQEAYAANGYTVSVDTTGKTSGSGFGRKMTEPTGDLIITDASGKSTTADANVAAIYAFTPQQIADLPADVRSQVSRSLINKNFGVTTGPWGTLAQSLSAADPNAFNNDKVAVLRGREMAEGSSWNTFRDTAEGVVGNFVIPAATAGLSNFTSIDENLLSQGARDNWIDPRLQTVAGVAGAGAYFGASHPASSGSTVQPSYFGPDPVPAGTTDYLGLAGNPNVGLADTGIAGGGLTGVPGAGGSSFTMPITPTTGINQPTGNAFSGSTGSNTGYDIGLGGTGETLGAVGTGASLSDAVDPSLAQVLGAVAPSVLGYIGSKDIADQQAQLAREYMALGAPSRSRYEASYAPDFTMANDPGYTDALNQTSKSVLHGLSAQGNPADSPNAWAQSLSDIYQQTAYPALQNYRTTNATAGGLASAFPAGVDANNANLESQGNMWNAIGAGASSLNNIFNTPAQSSWDKYLQSITR